MDKSLVAPLQDSNNSCSPCVIRSLSDLDVADKHSVIYEIARIETMISRLAGRDEFATSSAMSRLAH